MLKPSVTQFKWEERVEHLHQFCYMVFLLVESSDLFFSCVIAKMLFLTAEDRNEGCCIIETKEIALKNILLQI